MGGMRQNKKNLPEIQEGYIELSCQKKRKTVFDYLKLKY